MVDIVGWQELDPNWLDGRDGRVDITNISKGFDFLPGHFFDGRDNNQAGLELMIVPNWGLIFVEEG